MKKKKIIFAALLMLWGTVLQAEAPSNEELHNMIKELQEKHSNLQKEAEAANLEAEEAKAELAKVQASQEKTVSHVNEPHESGGFASVEYVSLTPDFNNNVAFNREIEGDHDNLAAESYDWDNESGYRIKLGYLDDSGIGVRLTHFDYDASQTEVGVVDEFDGEIEANFFDDPDIQTSVGDEGDQLTAQAEFDISATDIEMLFPMNRGKNQYLFGFGIRLSLIHI